MEPKSILEWGPGGSTRLLVKECRDASILSIEHNPTWFERYRSSLGSLENVELALVSLSTPPEKSDGYTTLPLRRPVASADDKCYDLVFVDGRSRCDCLVTAFEVLSDHGIVILHDSERPRYEPGWSIFPFASGHPRDGTLALARKRTPLQRYEYHLARELNARGPQHDPEGS